MASESCSTSSSSSGDDFVPIFLLRKVMKSLRRGYVRQEAEDNTVNETDTAAAEAQSGENESNPDLYLWPPASQVRTHSGVSVESALLDRKQDCVCCFDYVERVEKVHSASNDCTLIYNCRGRLATVCTHFLQLLVLEGVERLFGHDQAPSKRLPHPQVSGNLLFFATCASLLRRWIVHSPLFVFFLQIFAVSGSD